MNETVTELERTLKRKLQVNHQPSRHEVLHAYADHSKVLRAFEAKATVFLREGVDRDEPVGPWASPSEAGSRR